MEQEKEATATRNNPTKIQNTTSPTIGQHPNVARW